MPSALSICLKRNVKLVDIFTFDALSENMFLIDYDFCLIIALKWLYEACM